MPTSNNGWSKDPVSTTRIFTGSDRDGCEVRAGDVETIFAYLLTSFHAQVEPVVTASGYRSTAVNKASGGIATSNHLSATAIDINGFKHPYEATRPRWLKFLHYVTGFTTAKVAAVRKILANLDGVVRWGLDFPRGWRDGMHFEIQATPAQVARVAAKIRAAAASASSHSVTNTLEPKEEDEDMGRAIEAFYRLHLGRKASVSEVDGQIEAAVAHDLSLAQLRRAIIGSVEGKAFAARPAQERKTRTQAAYTA